MLFREFNMLEKNDAAAILRKCCGSEKWSRKVLEQFPYSSQADFMSALNDGWYNTCSENDWKEAFLHHPEIGDVNSLQEKYASAKEIAISEQAGVNAASRQTLQALVNLNKEYKEKFGFIFIVYATGKTAEEMLAILGGRISNSVEEELMIAMGEQQKITIKRLMGHIEDFQPEPSQLTTHILNTTSGRPAAGVVIKLAALSNGKAQTITQGITNADGRIPDLLPPGRILPAGDYRMHFQTAGYFSKSGIDTFFPYAEIAFTIAGAGHYHIPLLISPFGYTTYRGS